MTTATKCFSYSRTSARPRRMTLLEAYEAAYSFYKDDELDIDEVAERVAASSVGMVAAIGMLDEIENDAELLHHTASEMIYVNPNASPDEMVVRDLPDWLWARAWEKEELLIEELRAVQECEVADRLWTHLNVCPNCQAATEQEVALAN